MCQTIDLQRFSVNYALHEKCIIPKKKSKDHNLNCITKFTKIVNLIVNKKKLNKFLIGFEFRKKLFCLPEFCL